MIITEILTITQIKQANDIADYVQEHAEASDLSAIVTYGRFVAAGKSAPETVRAAFVEAAVRTLPNSADPIINDLMSDQAAAFLDCVARTVFNCRRLS